MIEFPKNFFWGAALSAYQAEGNNINSDWWDWEKRVGLKETSGEACRHYEFYRQDFDLAKLLLHNAHRLSIEWSRIEPEEGKFSSEEINHYIEVINYLRQLNIEPIVTLHHFTNPLWFLKSGGWQNKKACSYFLRYVEKILDALSDNVRFWVTINEPMVYAYHSYILGIWPPQEKSFLKAKRVIKNLIISHIKTYELIHSVYRNRNLALPSVSIAKNFQAFEACRPTLKNRIAVFLRDKSYNFDLINRLVKCNCLDYIGVNYYTRNLADARSFRIKNLLLDTCKDNHGDIKRNYLGWDIYPQGLFKILVNFKKYNLPAFILENGICTEDDNLRWDFICQHLKNVGMAMDRGVNVLGYLYWSLIDNFEWDKGFKPRFGLIAVDYNNYKRTIRESAKKFSEICKTKILV